MLGRGELLGWRRPIGKWAVEGLSGKWHWVETWSKWGGKSCVHLGESPMAPWRTCWGSGPGRRNSPEVDTASPGDNVEVISLKSFPNWKFHSICRMPIAHAYFNFPLDISSLSLSFLLDFHSFFVQQILSTSENDFWNQTPWIVFCAMTYCVTWSEWLHCTLRLSLSNNKIEMIKAPTSGGC